MRLLCCTSLLHGTKSDHAVLYLSWCTSGRMWHPRVTASLGWEGMFYRPLMFRHPQVAGALGCFVDRSDADGVILVDPMTLYTVCRTLIH
jgi:hypothetical protein